MFIKKDELRESVYVNTYKDSDAYKIVRVVWAMGLVLLMLIEGCMFGSKYTRRTADEIAKIESAKKFDYTEVQRKAKECIDAGGLPKYNTSGGWYNCDKK